MQESSEVAGALAIYWGRAAERDFDGVDGLITRGQVAKVIGTAPGEGHDNRDQWVAGFRSTVESMPGLKIEPGPLKGYAEGDVGFAVDEPTWVLPGDVRIPTRTTAVLQREDGDWKLVHLHVSLGVPDEKMMDLLADTSPATA